MKLAIYPGSFDPFTNGHKEILGRTCKIFDMVIVAIAADDDKQSLFTLQERQYLIERATADLPHVQIDTFKGLVVDYAHQKKAQAIIRGLRTVSDFEYEMQMAIFHKQLCPDIETIFLTASPENSFISAASVWQIAALGGDVKTFVPEIVAATLEQKYKRKRN